MRKLKYCGTMIRISIRCFLLGFGMNHALNWEKLSARVTFAPKDAQIGDPFCGVPGFIFIDLGRPIEVPERGMMRAAIAVRAPN